MTFKWPSIALSEVCVTITDGSHFSPAQSEEGYAYVTVRDLQDGEINLSGAKRISEKSFLELSKNGCAPQLGDVLFSKDGTVGKVALVSNSELFVVLSSIAILRPNTKVLLPEFLAFVMQSPKFLADAIGKKTGTAIRRIVLKDLKRLTFYLPPLDEQKRIVAKLDEALGYVDELIDLQKQVVSAQGNFWSKALSAKFADQQKQTIGSSKAPCTLVKLGDIAKLIRGPFGGSITKAMFVEEGFAVYEQQHAIGNQFADFRYFVNATKFEELKRFEVRPGHLIMSCAGTIGRVAEVPESAPRGIINQALMKIIPSEVLDSAYLRLYLSGSVFQDQLDAGAKGSALKNAASVSDLRELLIPLPPLDEQQKIVRELLDLKSGNDLAVTSAMSKLDEITILRSSVLSAAFAGDF